MQTNTQDEIRSTVQKFQDGYTVREAARLDDFLQFFAPHDESEMIGISAAKRAANGETTWLLTTGTVTHTQAFDTSNGFHPSTGLCQWIEKCEN